MRYASFECLFDTGNFSSFFVDEGTAFLQLNLRLIMSFWDERLSDLSFSWLDCHFSRLFAGLFQLIMVYAFGKQ